MTIGLFLIGVLIRLPVPMLQGMHSSTRRALFIACLCRYNGRSAGKAPGFAAPWPG
jgi:hypothetical protein